MLDVTIELQKLLENKIDKNNTGFYIDYYTNNKQDKVVNKFRNKKTKATLTYEVNENDLHDDDLGNGLDVQTYYHTPLQKATNNHQRN